MSDKITGIVIVFEDGQFAVPDVSEVMVVDRASGKEVFNVTGDIKTQDN